MRGGALDSPAATRFRIPRDVWIGLAALVLAGLYRAGAGGIPVSPLDGVVNARAMPEALSFALALFSLLLIARALLIESVRVRAARRSGAPAAAAPAEEGRRFTWRQHLKAGGVLLLGVAYLLLLPWLGYLPVMILFIVAVAVYIGARPSAYTLAVAVGVAVSFYLLFDWLLGIPMPSGILSDLAP